MIAFSCISSNNERLREDILSIYGK